jgi:hypothetical protein
MKLINYIDDDDDDDSGNYELHAVETLSRSS